MFLLKGNDRKREANVLECEERVTGVKEVETGISKRAGDGGYSVLAFFVDWHGDGWMIHVLIRATDKMR
jgi:hypothetical protein